MKEANGDDRHISFFQLIENLSARNKIVHRYRNDLKELGDLRNAIVHERTDGHVIAEPNQRAVEDIKRIEFTMRNPPLVLPMFKLNVRSRLAHESIGDAVCDMRNGSFSQLPILSDKNMLSALLTTETISRWLAHEMSNEVVSLWETKIETVLPHAESTDHYCMLSRSATLFDVLAKFEDFTSRGKDLDAALITDSGKKDQKLLGIITVYDLPRILSKIGMKKLSSI